MQFLQLILIFISAGNGIRVASENHGIKLVSKIVFDGEILSGCLMVDKENNVHVLVANLSSVKSYDLQGNIEWIVPGYTFFAPFEIVPDVRSNFTLLLKLMNKDSVKIGVVHLRTGSIVDSFFLKNSLNKFPQTVGMGDNYFLSVFRKDSPLDTPRIEILKLNRNGRLERKATINAGFYLRKSVILEDDIGIFGVWAPLNGEAPGIAGISDLHVGVIEVSLRDGKVLNRLTFPFNSFSRSNVISPVSGDRIFATYRGNFRNELSTSGIYMLKIPELKVIKHIEVKGNIFFANKLINGRIIAGGEEKSLKVYLFSVPDLELLKIIDMRPFLEDKKFKILPNTKVRYLIVPYILDVNNDGNDDLVIKLGKLLSCVDARWDELSDENGKFLFYTQLLIIPGPDFDTVYPNFLSDYREIGTSVVESKRIIAFFAKSSPSKVLIYRMY